MSRSPMSHEMAQGLGFYGKLPYVGDFVSRRLPGEFIRPWDQEAFRRQRRKLNFLIHENMVGIGNGRIMK